MTREDGVVGRSPAVRVAVGSGTEASDVLVAARESASTVEVAEVGSAGVDAFDPLVTATLDNRTAFHPRPSPEEVADVVEALEREELPEADAAAVVDHETDRDALPVPASGPLSVGARRVLGPCGWVAPTVPADYGALVAPDAADDPEGTLEAVATVGVLGRGRGDAAEDAPVTGEWTTARDTAEKGEPVVAVNANESYRPNRTDRTLLEGAPVAVLDGAAAIAAVVDATDVVVYLNEADDLAERRVREAAAAVAAESDASAVDVTVATGPDSYIAGETTMALEALEGNDRLEARLSPPSPAAHGLYGRPTVVHTPRTLAQVRAVLRSPEVFDAADADPGTRLVSVVGDVEAPATVELPTATSLAAARDAVTPTGTTKMAAVGGRFGGLARSLDVPASAPSLSASGLGTDGVVELLDEGTCPVAVAGRRARFASEENCGRCVPCREGSKQLLDLLRDVYDGAYHDDELRELTRVMRTTSTCGFGPAAARPVVTGMDRFETEFEAHAEGRCPSGECSTETHT